MSEMHGLISTATLAVVEAALAGLMTGTEMTSLLEQFGFVSDPHAVYHNKLQRARAYLKNADWNDPETLERLLAMLSHVFGPMASRKDHEGRSNLDRCPVAQRVIEALAANDGISWYGVRFCLPPSAALEEATNAVAEFTLAELDNEITRIHKNVSADPADTITSARALVESTCQHILADYGREPSSGAALNELVTAVLECLQLTPEDVSAEAKGRGALRKIVRSMRAALDGLVELRGLYGDSHGKEAGFVGLEPRHARLAATLAGMIATFLMETHQCRKDS